jgi:iron-sulfur cluster assembly accessory protein
MITLTDPAQERIRTIIRDTPDAQGKVLRLFVEGGGCSGFQYGFAFDDKQADDTILNHEGFDVAIDPQSAKHLTGVKIDWVESLQGAGFKIENPNATGGCGCGKSFSC